MNPLGLIKYVFRETKNALKYSSLPTYYPEKQRKSSLKRIKDNLSWLVKYKEPNRFYTLYGLDVEDNRNPTDYMDYLAFMMQRDPANRLRKPDSQVPILRDKFMFYRFLSTANVPTPEVFAILIDGTLYDSTMSPMQEDEFLKEKGDYFIKDMTGECASFVKHIKDYTEYSEIKPEINEGKFLLQKRIYQCDEMNKINPCAINTLRIVTVNKNGQPYPLTALLRVGTSKSGNVDNWAAGGLAVGVNEDGHLKEFGFYKHASDGKTTVHPDTNIVFSEFAIPQYKACVDTVVQAHKLFYNTRFIGWDVAITNDGPVIIEGNDNWEISLMQAADRPLRADWEKAYKD